MVEDVELNRLFWHSRRGMLELDVLLVPFVREVYANLNDVDRELYRRLLECEDQDMFGWFMQRGESEDPELQRMVRMILDRVQPSEPFECRWQASKGLLTAYLFAQALAWLAVWLLDIPLWASLTGLLLCLAHAAYVLPRSILLSHTRAFKALRHGRDGWQVWSGQGGWQPVQIMADSLALPLMVVLRFRLLHGERPGWRAHSVCIARDGLAPDIHRRLRVRLRFARRG